MNWSQLRTVFWLRWRLIRNQWSRSGGVGPALAAIAAVAGIMLGLAAGIGGVLGGVMGLAQASPRITLLVWDILACIFLFLWLLGVLAEIQRSETIDLGRLLHLPVSLEWVFLVNYLASHLTLGIIVFVPGALGLCLGLVWKKGLVMLLLVPLVLAFFFMVTAWTYCLRGWLVSLMVNPRRRRNVIMGVTLTLVLLPQLPNLYFNVYLGRMRKRSDNIQAKTTASPPSRTDNSPDHFKLPQGWLRSHAYIPPLWLPRGAMGLAGGDVWPAIWGSLGAFALGVAGLARAYRSTMQFYAGREKVAALKPVAPARVPGAIPRTLLDRQIPVVSPEVSALALASFRSLTRAPEVKMSLVSNGVVILVIGGMLLTQHTIEPGGRVQLLMVPGACAFTFFGLLQLMFNQFGFDRDGFRALMLLPTPRKKVFLAKNLALAPVAFGLGLTLLVFMTVLARLPVLLLLAGCFQLAAMFLLLSLVGNFLTVVAPYRVTAGSLKPTKASGKTVLLILLSQMLFPVAALPVFLPSLAAFFLAKWLSWPAPPVDALFSLLAALLAAFVYRASLDGLARLLDRRERDILLVVSQEVE